jgi:pSer/pThr/pTyr-binding forkhead associated (FHA) protein
VERIGRIVCIPRLLIAIFSSSFQVFIKDVKSSNGTFINGSRLSPEGQESDTFELHSDDIVEFGIDIVGEDNKTRWLVEPFWS